MVSNTRRSHAMALALALVLMSGLSPTCAPALGETLQAERIDEPGRGPGLNPVRIAGPFAFPWSIAFLPDHAILLTEQPGRLQVIRSGRTTTVAGVPSVMAKGHGGLLDVALDPAFAANGIVYLSYTSGTETLAALKVMRARLDLSRHELLDQQVIFESQPGESPEQWGGRLALSPDGHLFLSLGARWQAIRAQRLDDLAGKIVRIRSDGSIPQDNPFVMVPGARPEIWSYGHRNPQGLALDTRGRLWSHEHGPLGGDELNLIVAGANYGWPVVTHGRNYSGEPVGTGPSRPGMEAPLRHWTPAIAPSGLAVQVEGGRTLIWIGALAEESVVLLEMEADGTFRERRFLKGRLGRIRDVRIGPDGSLYAIVDAPRGGLYRLEAATE